jgi:integrase
LGKEKSLSLGVYPKVGLKEARAKRDTERKHLDEGLDPSTERKVAKLTKKLNAQNSFEAMAREWHESRKHMWTDAHGVKILRRLEVDIFPQLGSRPITAITPPELLAALRKIESRGALDLTHRMHQVCSQVFTYAIATGRVERNPATDLRGALKPAVTTHNAYLKANELPEFLQKLEGFDGTLQTKLAMKLLLLTMLRTGELRQAKWSEIDIAKAEWGIPAERMKVRAPHVVPLSKQALAVLEELKPLTGHSEYIFPNQHKPRGCMSENTILYALYRMGYHGRSTGHGFRATASTILNEHNFNSDWVEKQLAHRESNEVRKAYNHAQYMKERRNMLQWWGDYLEKVQKNGN